MLFRNCLLHGTICTKVEKIMTAEESAIKKIQDESFFEILVESVARKAAEIAYFQIKHDKIIGAGNTVDCIIRKTVLKKIEKLAKVDSLNSHESHR